jgi:hypothetical protein
VQQDPKAEPEHQEDKPQSGYRSNWKKWVAIYLVAGAVIYLVIYLAINAGGGGYGG